jgi:SET domain-containing protein
MGIGVIATKRIGRGVLLGEYTGTIKTLQEVIERAELDPPYYTVATETVDHFIDGEGDQGNILKYINHKCTDPNCRLVNLTPTRVGIQTRRSIQPNETLSYNYNLIYPEGSVERRIKCVCTPECVHYL